MEHPTTIQKEQLELIEKINAVFLGTRDFRELASKAVNLIGAQLKDEGAVGTAIFRVHPTENSIHAYAFSSKAFATVEKLLPKKVSELNVSMDEESNLLVKAARTKETQESDRFYDFTRPALSLRASDIIQHTIGSLHGIALPLRLKQEKIFGVLLFGFNKKIEEQQRMLIEAFRAQLELAFENVIEFEKIVEKFKNNSARTFPGEDSPTVRFTLRITPKQNAALESKAKSKGVDKTFLIREWLDELS